MFRQPLPKFTNLPFVDLFRPLRLRFRELEVAMIRERSLKIVLVLVGLIFVAGVYPLITSVRDGWQMNKEEAEPMGIGLYVMMGIFLLVAARNPAANRGVI